MLDSRDPIFLPITRIHRSYGDGAWKSVSCELSLVIWLDAIEFSQLYLALVHVDRDDCVLSSFDIWSISVWANYLIYLLKIVCYALGGIDVYSVYLKSTVLLYVISHYVPVRFIDSCFHLDFVRDYSRNIIWARVNDHSVYDEPRFCAYLS